MVILLLVIVPSSLMYPMPYAWFLASCSLGSHMLLFLFLTLCSPLLLPPDSLSGLQIALWGSVAPLLSRVFSH